MASRHMCPSLGVLRRSLAGDAAAGPSRALHSSARRLEEQPGGAAPAPTTRKARAETALKQITNLQARRAAPASRLQPNTTTTSSSTSTQERPAFRFARTAAAPPTTRRAATPGGQMVRAPSQLRISRDAGAQGPRSPRSGPNLRGRDGPGRPGGARAGPGRGRGTGGAGPKGPVKRDRQKQGGGEDSGPMSFADTPAAHTLSDGMVHNLLRLQRKEWDRVPYEPKYAPGSFAANELVHIGRELFRGECPPVKIWGPLEKRIGVVGMFGAEASLKVRRVIDDSAGPVGGHDVVRTDDPLPEKAQSPSSKQTTKKPEASAVQ